MLHPQDQTINSDVLVIGSGAAGVRAAIEAKKLGADVILLSEFKVGTRNNTIISKGTLAASGLWKKGSDSPESHFMDTFKAGRYLNDTKLVKLMTVEAESQVYDLEHFGAQFIRENGDILIRHLPGHEHPRHISAENFRGINIIRPMRIYAHNMGIRIIENILVTKLLKVGEIIAGAMGMNRDGRSIVFRSKSVVLATGGAGGIFLRNNNSKGITGDGYALAFDAGAILCDMEFVQFYPTCAGNNGAKIYSYERYLPKGAIIKNKVGTSILEIMEIDKLALPTRDLLARVIMAEIIGGRGISGNLFFDFSPMMEREAQNLCSSPLDLGLNRLGKVLVAPSAHYFMGGLIINENSETGIEGLYAAGEVCGGVHGANRLNGNSLIEAFVFGTIAGRMAALRAQEIGPISMPYREIAAELDRINEFRSATGDENVEELEETLKRTNWECVGVIRNKNALEKAQKTIILIKEKLKYVRLKNHGNLCQAIKLTNMLTVSEMICKSALIRSESRGAHYRTDYPEENNSEWLSRFEISCKNGKMLIKKAPVK